jgi:hypothetical protein
VPDNLVTSLTEAAHLADLLDRRMEKLHGEVRGETAPGPEGDIFGLDEKMLMRLWDSARAHGDGVSGRPSPSKYPVSPAGSGDGPSGCGRRWCRSVLRSRAGPAPG